MKAAIYIGKRIDEKENPGQVVPLANFARFKGWDYEIFSEFSNIRESQSIKEEVLIRLRKNEFKVVIIDKLTEWASTSDELIEGMNLLQSIGIRFISLRENFDTSTATGRLYLNVLSTFDVFEKSLITGPILKSPLKDNSSFHNYTLPGSTIETTRSTGSWDSTKSEFDVIDFNQACKLTGYSKHSLYQMTSRHQIPYIKRSGGRKLFFSRKALQDWFMTGSD